jgi:putative PIG3 family NAD(P)H quinone oxidoreductase
MPVIEMSGPGGPEVLRLSTRPVPAPKPGQILVRVVAAGVNGPDIMQRKGLYPPPPGASDLLGLEISGEVVALGEGVAAWAVGDRVCGLTDGGGYAGYCVLDATHALPIPPGVSVVDAAGLPETFITVWSNLFLEGQLGAADRLLVHGGAGGIGATAIQLAHAFGARVFATDSPAERCRFCEQIGADRAIDYDTEDFVEVLREARGATMILDVVGGPYVERNIKAAAAGARIVQLAFALGSKVEINLMPVMLKRLVYTGSTLRTRPAAFKARVVAELRDQVWPKFASGAIRTVTNEIFPLAEAGAAHARMQAAGHMGKILLAVSE